MRSSSGLDTRLAGLQSGTDFRRKDYKPLLVDGPDIGQRSETVRRANLSAIVRGLHERGPLSRSDLVAATGLTRSAIRSLVGELASAGFVTEGGAVRLGTPGRPSPLVRLETTSAGVLCLEILVDSIAAAIVGLGGETIAKVRVQRPRGELSVDEVVADLAALAKDLMARVDVPVIGIGVAVAGVVRQRDGVVTMAPNLGWIDVPLGSRLARALATALPIHLLNDADAGVLGEHRRGVAQDVDDVVYISGEVGIGGGLVIDGRLVSGATGFAGEVGHVTLNPEGRTCRCGSVGCWETEVGEGRLLALAGRPADAGRQGIEEVLDEAAAGGEVAVAAIDHVGRWLGVGLAMVVNVLNPRLVILGGPHARLHPFVAHTIDESLTRFALPASRAVVRVVPGELGVDAPLVGAAEAAFEPLLSDPAAWFARRDRAFHLASA
jgi:predicted NBD/HSP70 family sugar kinase